MICLSTALVGWGFVGLELSPEWQREAVGADPRATRQYYDFFKPGASQSFGKPFKSAKLAAVVRSQSAPGPCFEAESFELLAIFGSKAQAAALQV